MPRRGGPDAWHYVIAEIVRGAGPSPQKRKNGERQREIHRSPYTKAPEDKPLRMTSMKRDLRSIFPAVLALLVLAPVPDSWGSDLETVRQSMSAVKSISADFIQSKNMKILSKPLTSKGHFYYLAPGNLRWEYISPVKNVLLMDQGTIRKYSWRDGRFEPDLSSKLEPMRVVMEQISGCLNGSFAENKYFTASLMDSDPEKIELTPRGEEFAKMIQRIIISLSKVPGVIQSVEILEPGNSSTLIKFDRVQLDSPLPEKIFQSVP